MEELSSREGLGMREELECIKGYSFGKGMKFLSFMVRS